MTKESSVSAMVDLDQEQAASTAVNMNSKKKELLSTALKRTSEWSTSFIFFYLHSFPSHLFSLLSFKFSYGLCSYYVTLFLTISYED